LSPKAAFTYSVSFEFDTRPAVTLKGTVDAGQPHVGASRAIKTAKKALRPINWRSVVCVLERTDPAEEPEG
jgi:hypothetical protein